MIEDRMNVWTCVSPREGGTITTLVTGPAPSDSDFVVAGTLSGLFTSSDAGRTWRSSTAGILSPYVQSVAFSPGFAEDSTLLVGTSGHGAFP